MQIIFTGLNIAPIAYRDSFINSGVSSLFVLSVFLFFFFSILLTNFILQVHKNFGEKNLIPLFLGRYHKPKDENRIFMFIDMHSSTTYAEKYGHSRFSPLIQDTVYDLNSLVYKYHAEIYQYVGDEIVLTWKVADGLPMANCIKIFLAFRNLLKKRETYYIQKYDQQPTFKAAAHIGVVSVVEIGDIKREIAYHGEVLNTTARIQGLCNELKEDLLITNDLAKCFGKRTISNFPVLDNTNSEGRIHLLRSIQLRLMANIDYESESIKKSASNKYFAPVMDLILIRTKIFKNTYKINNTLPKLPIQHIENWRNVLTFY